MADHFRTALDWEDVRFFVALARHGSLSAAARALGVNHATVARRLATFEGSVGAPLFERRPSGYVLTAAGQRVLEGAAAMDDAASRIDASSSSPQAPLVTGTVRITATPSIAEAFVIPRLGALLKGHPGLDIEIFADRRLLSLARYEADLALRLGRPADSALLGQKLATLGFGLYAAPGVAETYAGRVPAAPFISFEDTGAALPEAVWLRETLPEARVAFRANGQMAQAAAARAGLGVAPLPHFLAAGDPLLVQLPFRSAPPPRELWMLSRPNSDRTERLGVVKAWLVRTFQTERASFDRG